MINHKLYSVVIPAFNEEKWLPDTLGALNRIMTAVRMPGEIIVVDNNSTDQTARIAGQFNARVVFEPVNQISRARNTGARAAKGTYLIFLDADTLPSRKLLESALNRLQSGKSCGGGTLVTFREKPSTFVRQALAFWNSISHTFGLAAGCFVFCLQKGFEDIGGFSEKVFAGEEIVFSRKMRAWGRKRKMTFEILTDDPVVTSLRKVKWLSFVQALQLLLVLICPLALRSKHLCAFWYRRPPG